MSRIMWSRGGNKPVEKYPDSKAQPHLGGQGHAEGGRGGGDHIPYVHVLYRRLVARRWRYAPDAAAAHATRDGYARRPTACSAEHAGAGEHGPFSTRGDRAHGPSRPRGRHDGRRQAPRHGKGALLPLLHLRGNQSVCGAWPGDPGPSSVEERHRHHEQASRRWLTCHKILISTQVARPAADTA